MNNKTHACPTKTHVRLSQYTYKREHGGCDCVIRIQLCLHSGLCFLYDWSPWQEGKVTGSRTTLKHILYSVNNIFKIYCTALQAQTQHKIEFTAKWLGTQKIRKKWWIYHKKLTSIEHLNLTNSQTKGRTNGQCLNPPPLMRYKSMNTKPTLPLRNACLTLGGFPGGLWSSGNRRE